MSQIARNGHVYQPIFDPFAIAKAGGGFKVHLVGIKNASTFSGFCPEHDANLFEAIDRTGFVLDSRAIFALHYRALCKELSAKVPSIKSDENLRQADRGLPEEFQKILQQGLDSRSEATNLALRELQEDKINLDQMLLEGRLSELHSLVMKFECKPIVACSGYVQPVFDFRGNILQDLNNKNKRVYSQSFSIIPFQKGHTVVLSWLPNADIPCRAFAQSLLDVDEKKKSTAILLYLFNGFENFALEPNWWESRDPTARKLIEEQMSEWIGPTPFFHLVDPEALRPDNVHLADWKVLEASFF